MQLEFNTIVVMISTSVPVGLLLLSNKWMIDQLKLNINANRDEAIKSIATEKAHAMELVEKMQFYNMKEFKNIDGDIEALKSQLKTAIYPRLDSVEKLAERNTLAVENCQQRCDLKCIIKKMEQGERP